MRGWGSNGRHPHPQGLLLDDDLGGLPNANFKDLKFSKFVAQVYIKQTWLKKRGTHRLPFSCLEDGFHVCLSLLDGSRP